MSNQNKLPLKCLSLDEFFEDAEPSNLFEGAMKILGSPEYMTDVLKRRAHQARVEATLWNQVVGYEKYNFAQ